MKVLLCLTLAVSALASPALSFAQTADAPLTRAQVRADLVRLEKAGYDPSRGDYWNYPVDIQAAEAKVAAEDAGHANNAVGGVADDGTSRSGPPASPVTTHSIYFGH
jgi:hypothetical protein